MIPIKFDEDDNQEEVGHAYNPFMRGVMEFDDYNYACHNPYVLVEDPKYADDEKVMKKNPEGMSSNRSGAQELTQRIIADQMDPTFS